MEDQKNFELEISSSGTRVSASLWRPPAARHLLVLGHGAGAGMRHPFMERLAESLYRRGLATLRYQFPYMERNERRPDPPPRLIATVGAAVRFASERAPDLRLLAGGKSLGGRMTSLAASEGKLTGILGLVFFGFPLHPAGSPAMTRAEHLRRVTVPMLFLQGTKDKLAEPALIQDVCNKLGSRATYHAISDADHSFHVPKRTGRTDDEVLDHLTATVASWITRLS